MIKLHLLNTGKNFNQDKAKMIRSSFGRAVKTCEKLIAAKDVDIIIYHNPAYVIKEIGIGGKTPTTHVVDIPVDARRKIDPESLYLTICHELHHAMRQRKFGFPKTLFDAVISEGLADQFEVEINPKRRPITFRKDIHKNTLLNGLADLKKEMYKNNYDYFGWFFGTKKYPNYFGYTLGNMVVESHISTNKTKPSKLIGKNTKSFLKSMETVVTGLKK